MALSVVRTDILFRDYLQLGVTRLHSLRKDGGVHVLSPSIDEAGFRIALMLAPLGQAWGMQYRHPVNLHAVMEDRLSDDAVAACVKHALGEAGIPQRWCRPCWRVLKRLAVMGNWYSVRGSLTCRAHSSGPCTFPMMNRPCIPSCSACGIYT